MLYIPVSLKQPTNPYTFGGRLALLVFALARTGGFVLVYSLGHKLLGIQV